MSGLKIPSKNNKSKQYFIQKIALQLLNLLYIDILK